MDRYDFPFHVVSHTFPRGDSFLFGRGYQFTATPQMPQQRTFRLSYTAMVYFAASDGTLDHTSNPQINMQTLIAFYEAHRGVNFIYAHCDYGDVTVQFAAGQTFETPKRLPNGNGVTDSFEVFFLEQLL